MEQPDELILNVASGISSLTETDLEKTSRDICQVTEDEIEKNCTTSRSSAGLCGYEQ